MKFFIRWRKQRKSKRSLRESSYGLNKGVSGSYTSVDWSVYPKVVQKFFRWIQKITQNKGETDRPELLQSSIWIASKPSTKDLYPYVVTFRIRPIPNGDAIPNAVAKGVELRRFIHANVLWKVSLLDNSDTVGQNLVADWDEIIPSASRFPTHRLEIGIVRKKGHKLRSHFLDEYFCFLPKDGGDSEVVATRIAGYIRSRLQEHNNFQGEALLASRSYWLMAIIVSWKRFR